MGRLMSSKPAALVVGGDVVGRAAIASALRQHHCVPTVQPSLARGLEMLAHRSFDLCVIDTRGTDRDWEWSYAYCQITMERRTELGQVAHGPTFPRVVDLDPDHLEDGMKHLAVVSLDAFILRMSALLLMWQA